MAGTTRGTRWLTTRAPAPAGVLRSLALAGVLLPLVLAAPAAGQPTPTAPEVLDGPSVFITGPVSLQSSIARDGSGGIVYLRQVGGASHVFLSALAGGGFTAPVELDSSLAGSSSNPVIAADDGGELIVAFVHGGALYVTQRAGAGSPFSAPRVLAAAAASPSLQMTVFGKAYIAFTVPDGAGSDVRAAYYYSGRWSIESTPLNATPADDAGTGSGRPAVAAAGDGVAIVAWGERGHVFTRRVWGTSPSVVFEQADGALPGCSELSAEDPAIGTGGDSSYAAVAFRETLSCGGQTVSRVLENRLHGSLYDGIVAVDGLSGPGSDGAYDPAVAVGEYGNGWVTSERTSSFGVVGSYLDQSEVATGAGPVNTLPNASLPDPVPAMAGFYSTLIAWQHDPGGGGLPDIQVRFAQGGSTLGTEMDLSSSLPGSASAADGLTAGGDVLGEAAVAWVQSTPAGNEIVVDRLYQAPGAPAPQRPSGYVRTARPLLAWSPSSEPWGASYTITLDGVKLGQTSGTAWALATPLSQGPHTWQVSASNPAGLTSGVRSGSFFVDTIAPQVTLTLTGKRRVGVALKLHIADTDAPPPLPAADASGIATTLVRWGDRTPVLSTIHHWLYHVYRRTGRYRITVVVRDRAGNVTRVTLVITVKAKPKPRKRKPAPKSRARS